VLKKSGEKKPRTNVRAAWQTVREEGVGDSGEARLRRDLRLRSGFESPDLDGLGVVSTPRVSIGPEQGEAGTETGHPSWAPGTRVRT